MVESIQRHFGRDVEAVLREVVNRGLNGFRRLCSVVQYLWRRSWTRCGGDVGERGVEMFGRRGAGWL